MGGVIPRDLEELQYRCGSGGTPLVVCVNEPHLWGYLSEGYGKAWLVERFDRLRQMGD